MFNPSLEPSCSPAIVPLLPEVFYDVFSWDCIRCKNICYPRVNSIHTISDTETELQVEGASINQHE